MWEADPHALASQLPEWFDMMGDVRRFAVCSRLYDFGDHRVLLLLARRMQVAQLGWSGGSWPAGWGFGGALSEGGELTVEEARAIFHDLFITRPLRRYLSPPLHQQAVWAMAMPPGLTRVTALHQRVDLSGGLEQVRMGFTSRVRSLVARAQQSRVEVETDDTGRLIPVFEALRARSLVHRAAQDGVPLFVTRRRFQRFDPPGKIAAVARHLGARCVVRVAWVDGRPAAANIELRHRDTASGWRSVLDRELTAKVPANVYLSACSIEEACRAGYRWYELGDSPTPSIAHFKHSLGGTDVPVHTYWLERLPLARAENAALGLVKEALELWKRRPFRETGQA